MRGRYSELRGLRRRGVHGNRRIRPRCRSSRTFVWRQHHSACRRGRPVRHLVYLCGVIPQVGHSVFDQLGEMMVPGWNAGLSEPDPFQRTAWIDADAAKAVLFADCDSATARAAFLRMRRQARFPGSQDFSLNSFPDTPRTSVVCADDQMVNPDWSRRIAYERLDADVVDLAGGHFPMLSRPSVLAAALNGIVDKPG
ncbi:alpha/beta hydrolase [Mycolicibacterium moriokaense]|nr:alpha/beta hydrolase [Mycolicibacterium moriokaense]